MPEIVDPKWSLFIKVAELGSVTHAAAVLDQPQSVVSRQIGLSKGLEVPVTAGARRMEPAPATPLFDDVP